MQKQFLSKKATGPNALVEVTDGVVGVQSQSYPDMFSAYWARVEGFRDQDLLGGLRPMGGLVRTWTVRGTMHIIPSRDYHVYVLGSVGSKTLSWIEKQARKVGYPDQEERRDRIYRWVLEKIEKRSVTSEEVKRLVSERAVELGLKPGVWVGVREMCLLGLLVNAGREGSASLWMRAEQWVPRPKKLLSIEDYRVGLLRKYVARYGPVSRRDMLYWTGHGAMDLDRALESLAPELDRVKVEGSREEFYKLGDMEDAPSPPRVVLLPKFDSLMMGYRDKSRFLDLRHQRQVFRPQGMIEATILLDGFVAATWRRKNEGENSRVNVNLVRALKRPEKQMIEHELREYSEYLDSPIDISWQITK
jgi:Winged helix DNA-binding domain